MRHKDYCKIKDMVIDKVSEAKRILRVEVDEKLDIERRFKLRTVFGSFGEYADIKTILRALIDYLGLDVNQVQKETKIVIKPKKKRRDKCQTRKQSKKLQR